MKPKSLIPLILLIQVADCEWRRSQTSWSELNNDFIQNFTDSIFYIGNPYVSYKEYNLTKINGELVKTFYKCEHHRVLNETLPLRFAGKEYYWNDTWIRNETSHICEYIIGDYDGKLTRTTLNNAKVEFLYFKCGFFDTCDGLRCIEMNFNGKVVYISGISILLILVFGSGFVYWKCRGPKSAEKTRNNSFDTIVA